MACSTQLPLNCATQLPEAWLALEAVSADGQLQCLLPASAPRTAAAASLFENCATAPVNASMAGTHL